MSNSNIKQIINQVKHRFSITDSAAIAPQPDGTLCFLPIYPDAGCSFMLLIENNSSESILRITDYGSCYENAFHFCNDVQERELKARIAKCQSILTMEDHSDGSWRLIASIEDEDSLNDVDLLLDVFDNVFSITDSFVKGIFEAV